jgi:hypothetical protein
MKRCAFTICTKNYMGLALTLKESFLKYNQDFVFYIIIADSLDNIFLGLLAKNNIANIKILEAKKIMDVSETKFYEMAFKYDVTEFCTCIKPFGFEYFFEKGYEFVSYFDPDIFFFDKFYELYEDRDISVLLVPHILRIEEAGSGVYPEEWFSQSGIFNCDFIAFLNDETTKGIIAWWKKNAMIKFYRDIQLGINYDQRWIDFIPAFIKTERIYIIRNMGCNLSPCSYYERKIENGDDHFYVSLRNSTDSKERDRLCFMHFSAYNFRKLLAGIIMSSRREFHKDYDDVIPFVENYSESLNSSYSGDFINLKYEYDYYNNGIYIDKFHRRIFRKLLEKGMLFKNPFACGNNTFYELLNRSRIIDKSSKEFIRKGDIHNISTKWKIINVFFRMLHKILGIKRYTLFVRALSFYSQFENHDFLLKLKNDKTDNDQFLEIVD